MAAVLEILTDEMSRVGQDGEQRGGLAERRNATRVGQGDEETSKSKLHKTQKCPAWVKTARTRSESRPCRTPKGDRMGQGDEDEIEEQTFQNAKLPRIGQDVECGPPFNGFTP